MTIREVAKHAGVSVATVSAVINDNKYVSDELKQKVLKAIKELNYRPNRWAKSLATGKGYTIAYIVPDITNPIFSRITKGIQDVANKKNYSVILASTNFDNPTLCRYVDWVLEMRVDGVVFTGRHGSTSMKEIRRLRSAHIPVVIALAPSDITSIDRVLLDDRGSSRTAVDFLKKAKRESIAFVGVRGSTTSHQRYLGYKDEIDGWCEELLSFGEDFTWDDGYAAARALLEQGGKFDGLFAASDIMALGVMACLKEHGYHVPTDIQIMGFDNTYAQWSGQAFASMSIPAFEMGMKAATQLFDRMDETVGEIKNYRLVAELAVPNKGPYAKAIKSLV